jgi:transposase
VDLPPLSLVTTQHRVQKKVCPDCGYQAVATFPAEVAASVQYGPRLKALGVSLKDFQWRPYARIAGLFADLFDASFSAGTLFACEQDASARLEPVVCGIRQGLREAEVVHFDETGLRLDGRLHWLPVASTQTLTLYTWHTKRGKAGMDKAGILPYFGGTGVHDGWGSYQHYACDHAL